MEISSSPEIPPTLQNPRATPLPTAKGKNQERLDPKKRSETAETHPNSTTHACSPLLRTKKTKKYQEPASGSQHTRSDRRTALGNQTVPAGQVPRPRSQQPQQWQSTTHRQQQEERNRAGSGAHLRRAAADGAIPFFLLPTARRWVSAVEWQNGGRGSEREGDRERRERGGALGSPTRRQAQQTDGVEREKG